MTDSNVRLKKIQDFLKEKQWNYKYHEEAGCGSIDFEYRGILYHIWEFRDGEYGVETNVKNGGYNEDIVGDYEEKVIRIINSWK